MSHVGSFFLRTSLLLLGGISSLALATEQDPVAVWERDSALAAISSIRLSAAANEIGDISSLSNGKKTLKKLKALEGRADWPLPAREAVIYEFTRSLAQYPRDAVAPEIMEHLRNYQGRTLVPHEDHAGGYLTGKGHAGRLVPLFNIRGAATGIENRWSREESSSVAMTVLAEDPSELISLYKLSRDPNQRSGYLDALRYADMFTVLEVQDKALEGLARTPGLSSLVATTASITRDTLAIEQLLIYSDEAGLSTVLSQLDTLLDPSETASLLAIAVQQAPTTNAALAIAAWWPRLKHDPETRDLMTGLLADPALGASAALALAQQPDIQTIKMLQDTAAGNSSAARRAKMALDLSRDRIAGDSLR